VIDLKSISMSGVLLALFAVVGTGLVAFTHLQTKERIAENVRQSLLHKLEGLVPANSVDNDMVEDNIEVHRADLLGSQTTTIYRGRLQGRPVAAILTAVVPDGYGGPMNLLVAVRGDGSLAGVRVISHKETPGLGDRVEEEKSDWIHSFTGKSLSDPAENQWQVKRDGGYFDQFTGATITPRSVVKAVKNTLLYVREQGDRIYSDRRQEGTSSDLQESR
jgi:Na+-translocating ferredoxin:NAD+ oxidoreductase subunit G